MSHNEMKIVEPSLVDLLRASVHVEFDNDFVEEEEKYTTSFVPEIDEMIGGYRVGGLTLIGGPVASGRTKLSMKLIGAMVANGGRVVASLTEEAPELVFEEVCPMLVEGSSFSLAEMTRSHEVLIADLRKKLDAVKDPSMILVDNVQMFINPNQMNLLARELLSLGREYKVPVVVTSTLRRLGTHEEADHTHFSSALLSNSTVALALNPVFGVAHASRAIKITVVKHRDTNYRGQQTYYRPAFQDFLTTFKEANAN